MYKRYFQVIIILLAIASLSIDVQAGGGKRNGTAAAQQLLLPVNARALAMSGAYVAGFEGIDAIYYNPAGLGVSNSDAEAMFSYMSYIADINLAYAAVAVHFDGFGSLGFTVRSLDFGDIKVTDVANPNGTGAVYSPSYVTMGLTYSNALTDRIHVGVTFNLISERIERVSASGFAIDAGVQYNGVAGVDGLLFGVVLKNLGPSMSYEGADLLRTATAADSKRGSQFLSVTSQSNEMPSQLELGLAYTKSFSDQYSAVFASSFQNNNFSKDEYRLGAEFGYDDLLFLRGGYTYTNGTGTDNEEFIFGPTFGAGFKFQGDMNITVDYAFRAVEFFDSNHLVSVKLGF